MCLFEILCKKRKKNYLKGIFYINMYKLYILFQTNNYYQKII